MDLDLDLTLHRDKQSTANATNRKDKEEIYNEKFNEKKKNGGRKEVHPAELPYHLRLNNP